jgi:hypothetical protein
VRRACEFVSRRPIAATNPCIPPKTAAMASHQHARSNVLSFRVGNLDRIAHRQHLACASLCKHRYAGDAAGRVRRYRRKSVFKLSLAARCPLPSAR